MAEFDKSFLSIVSLYAGLMFLVPALCLGPFKGNSLITWSCVGQQIKEILTILWCILRQVYPNQCTADHLPQSYFLLFQSLTFES